MVRTARASKTVYFTLVLMAIVTSQVAVSQVAVLSPSDQKLLADFGNKAKGYSNKEHALAASKMKPTEDVGKLQQQRKQLRQAVQQARANARQGDFFTSETAEVFRKLLSDLLNSPEGKKIKVSLNHAEPGASGEFKVNGEFPNPNGQPIQSVPPTVLKVLPALPKGMDYCIAGKTLALRDSVANLVIDYLPNALP